MVSAPVAGLLAGLAGTVAMSMLMMPLMKGPGGPQVLWGKLRGIEPEAGEARAVGMLIHFGYGAFWGGALGWAYDALNWSGPLWLWGLGLGVFLMLLAAMAVMPALGMKPEPGTMGKMMAVMGASHLLYGLVTGLVLAALL